MTVKTSVYLDDAEKDRLARLALRTGTTEAELIRRGVRLVLDGADRPRPRVGLGGSGGGRPARETDELLAETGFGE